MDKKNKIGFIGAGIMGQGMVQNLLESGHEVNVIAHRNRRPIEELVALGAKEMMSFSEMANRCKIFILCLPSSQAVMSVCGVLFSIALPKTIIIDCTTNELITVNELARGKNCAITIC